ncbi:MAG TPA: histidine kinase dimerization/phospho-acceptor domain-containing protein [Usitatibacter sp.]|nr:histidine kinase dimerization/phospho-acceptor domain-containing protein [Usitatibacter sp.]
MSDGERLAQVAHDLRTPLNAIKTWAQVLADRLGEDDPEVQRALDGILAGVEQQAHLIERMLDAAAPPPR